MPTTLVPLIDVPFPLGGLDETQAFKNQPEGTCVDVQNMRPFEPSTGRARGGQRAGHTRYVNAQHSTTNQIQDINHIMRANTGAPSSSTVNIRTLTRIAVAGGNVKTFTTSAYTLATNGSAALSSTAPFIQSAVLFYKQYFADGVSTKYFDAATDTVSTWTASAGSLPVDSTNYPRLIVAWGGRIVQAGIKTDPQNWFMSAVGDADDWDYSPATETETMAVAGNVTAGIGKCPDKVNTLVPFTDDVLIFGCDHSIYQMSGNPAAGGRIDRISDTIGMAWGRPWCKDPQGVLYFFGSRGGVYRMVPNGQPERITTNKIDERLAEVDLETVLVSMVWDDRTQGAHLFLTDLGGAASTHYYYDSRTQSWWKDSFASASHNPVCVHLLDGDDASDRVVLLGCRDGYIRYVNVDGSNDDDQAIDSYVWLGPLRVDASDGHFLLTEMQVAPVTGSSDVTVDVYPGKDAQAAKAATSKLTRTATAGRNRSFRDRVQAHAMYLRLRNNTASQTWAMESVRVRLEKSGDTWQRRF